MDQTMLYICINTQKDENSVCNYLFQDSLTSSVTFCLPQSEGWGKEVKTKFLEMVKNKVVLMTIYREEDGILIVDLKKSPFSKADDMPVSLKDALVFLDLARYVFFFSLCSQNK